MFLLAIVIPGIAFGQTRLEEKSKARVAEISSALTVATSMPSSEEKTKIVNALSAALEAERQVQLLDRLYAASLKDLRELREGSNKSGSGPEDSGVARIQALMDKRYHTKMHPQELLVPEDVRAAIRASVRDKHAGKPYSLTDFIQMEEDSWRTVELYRIVGVEGVPIERMKKLVAKAVEKSGGSFSLAVVRIRSYVEAARQVQEFEGEP